MKSILFLALLISPTAAVKAQNFTISASHGDAQVGKDPHSYQGATVGTIYTIPSWGRTGDNSSLTVSFNAENRFRLLADSEAQVSVGSGDSSSEWHRVVSLKIGSASLDHNTGASPTVKLDCETPTAVCGAVGTEFEVNATEGKYTVTSGRISLESSKEANLSLPSVRGGSVIYNPGRENTYSHGNFSGAITLDGHRYEASNADFTISKKLDSDEETAVHISAGTLGGSGPGDYIVDGGTLKRIDPASKAASIHPQYLAAAQSEGALSSRLAADRAADVAAPGLDGQVSRAADEATRLRKELFNRETIRETVKQTTQSVIDNTLRSGGGGAGGR